MDFPRFKHIREFPQWVHDYNSYGEFDNWPKQYQSIADEIYKKANEVFHKIDGYNLENLPYDSCEVDNYMKANPSYYEHYRVITCNRDNRPDEWDYLYDSLDLNRKYYGSLTETKIGDWHLIMVFQHD